MATTTESKTTKATAKKGTAFSPTQEDIAFRAYELFLQRGGFEGSELEDWLIAEQELSATKPSRKCKAA